MALAILELIDFGSATASFNIDTGTNRLYVLKVGRSFINRSGIDWIDELTYATPPATNENAANLFHSSKEVTLPAARFSDGARFVQLFSFKSPDHRSPAFSKVVEIPGRIAVPARLPIRSYRAAMSLTATFAHARRVPARTAADAVARSASIDDLLASVVKLASPIVENLLKSGGGDTGKDKSGGGGGGGGGAGGGAGGSDGLAKVLAVLLRSLFGDSGGAAGASGAASPSVAKSMSMNGAARANRFADRDLAHPFIFGVDDALIGALAGPILQALPQLLNAVNQQKIQSKQADNRLVSDLVSDVNRRMILQQLAAAQPAAGSGAPAANSPEVAKLLALLQQAPAPGGAAPAPAVGQSLTMSEPAGATLSSRAVLAFQLGDPLTWNGLQRPLFAKGGNLTLKLALNVGSPAPKSPLPRAIIKVVFKDAADHSVLLEKTFKQKGIAAGAALPLDFSAAELAPLPGNKPLELIAEMRWLTAAGEYKALGSSEILLVGKYLLKSQGAATATEVELTDMKRFRPFWNKLWESPVLDGSGKASGDDAKYLWELDVNAKYSVVLAPEHESNGLMETKLLKAAADPESLSQRTAGRMKAGIELSLSELNKLLPLWSGQAVLEPAKLEALATAEFAKANAAELITTLKLSGRSGERGMVWAVPVFNLIECTLSSVSKTDDSGQVTALADETIRFPLPVSVRLIGLKSRS
jgi:hypothetical protein